MGATSKRKGKVGELEAARALEQHLGIAFRRGRQYSGSPDSPDVLPVLRAWGVHVEVKRTEKLSLYAALKQAICDAGSRIPLVLHRKNRENWVVIVQLKDLRALAAAVKALDHER